MDEAATQDENPAGTGTDRVDRVIESLAELDDLDVDQHVAVFERAHDELRRALDGGGTQNPVPRDLRPRD